jgi:hypothetical protein
MRLPRLSNLCVTVGTDDAVQYTPRGELIVDPVDSTAIKGLNQLPLLLESITLNDSDVNIGRGYADGQHSSPQVGKFLARVLPHCQRLRRIWLKGCLASEVSHFSSFQGPTKTVTPYPNVKEIRVDHCSLPYLNIHLIVSLFPELNSFVATIEGIMSLEEDPDTLHHKKAIADSISKLKGLEKLLIQASETCLWNPFPNSLLPSISNMSKLRRLAVDGLFMLGRRDVDDMVDDMDDMAIIEPHSVARHLPESIEDLTLIGDREEGKSGHISAILDSLAQEIMRGRLHKLRSVEVRLHHPEVASFQFHQPGVRFSTTTAQPDENAIGEWFAPTLLEALQEGKGNAQ